MMVRRIELTVEESIAMRVVLGEKIDKVMERLSNLTDNAMEKMSNGENCNEDEMLISYWENELETMKRIEAKLYCEPVNPDKE